MNVLARSFLEQHLGNKQNENEEEDGGDTEAPHDLTQTEASVLFMFHPLANVVNDRPGSLAVSYLVWGCLA